MLLLLKKKKKGSRSVHSMVTQILNYVLLDLVEGLDNAISSEADAIVSSNGNKVTMLLHPRI